MFQNDDVSFNFLVKKVGKRFPRSARLLMEESFPRFRGCGCIWGAFVFENSEQGDDYWLPIANAIDPDVQGIED